MTWHIAHCISGEERKVCERLTGQGESWHHSLLPGYVFSTAPAPTLRYVESLTGERLVLRVLPFSDRPQAIDADVVAVLQETCRAYDQAMKPLTKAQKFAENQPLAGMARKMVAQLLASAGYSVTMGAARVELTTSSPSTGRQHSAHQRRRAVRAVAGA